MNIYAETSRVQPYEFPAKWRREKLRERGK